MGRKGAALGGRRTGWFRKSLRATLDLLFPPVCAGCGSPGAHLCASCQSRISTLDDPLERPRKSSPRTTAPREGFFPDTDEVGVVRAWAAYRPPLTHALLELKYRPNRALAEILAAGMAETYRRCRWNASLVVPVPLAPARRRRRGFNQAGLLATALSQQLGIQLHVGALRRIRETRSQVGLGPKERRENVSGAFWANPELVSGERPLVVDDLTTTGSTLGACSQALFEAGALEVYGLAAAKAR